MALKLSKLKLFLSGKISPKLYQRYFSDTPIGCGYAEEIVARYDEELRQTIDARELIEYWNSVLPEKVDYADLVGAEGQFYGYCYVYEDEFGYVAEDTIKQLSYRLSKNVLRNEQNDGVYYVCPTCNSVNILHSDKYCVDCGQKLDWS